MTLTPVTVTKRPRDSDVPARYAWWAWFAHLARWCARMRIATFNVNGINGRLPVLLRWLAEALPEVVCLQELKAPDEKFPASAVREAGYGAIWHGQKSWNGVA